MFCKTYSAVVRGIAAELIEAEVDVKNGLPSFSLVGVSASETRETKERVRVAMENAGYLLPAKRITVNLSPADIKKEGTAFDLPVAIAVLTAFGHIPQNECLKFLMVGELCLDGRLRPVNGVLPIALAAKRAGIKKLLVPKQNQGEAELVEEMQVYGVSTLSEAAAVLKGEKPLPATLKAEESGKPLIQSAPDFSEVCGQETAKRALEIAAAGMHNLLLIGPPGSGKSMLAKCLPSILPMLSKEESMEVSKIYSVAGRLQNGTGLLKQPPFQAPHHTVTQAALTGGGRNAMPGMLSLAHRGVLFLDELPEFRRETLELLREPLEEKRITIARQEAVYTYPAGGILVAAMNPCPCGYYPDLNRCSCAEGKIRRYTAKVSGPVLDRIDLCAETAPPDFFSLRYEKKAEKSSEIRKRVEAARSRQQERFGNESRFNSDMTVEELGCFCRLSQAETRFMEKSFSAFKLSARAYHRILRLARTIADLEGTDAVLERHLAEAVFYRMAGERYFTPERPVG